MIRDKRDIKNGEKTSMKITIEISKFRDSTSVSKINKSLINWM